MTKFWNSVMMAGISVVLLALCAPGARAQSTSPTLFHGTVDLPFQAQWGTMILPAGEYTLHYGTLNGSIYVVEVEGKKKGSLHGLILTQPPNPSSAKASSLTCIREGGIGVVRKLEMPQIGRSVSFVMPGGAKLVASNHKGHAQKVEAQLRVQRIPVVMNAN